MEKFTWWDCTRKVVVIYWNSWAGNCRSRDRSLCHAVSPPKIWQTRCWNFQDKLELDPNQLNIRHTKQYSLVPTCTISTCQPHHSNHRRKEDPCRSTSKPFAVKSNQKLLTVTQNPMLFISSIFGFRVSPKFRTPKVPISSFAQVG